MNLLRRMSAAILAFMLTLGTVTPSVDAKSDTSGLSTGEVKTTLAKIDNSKWKYNEDNDVYYQVGISYCSNPEDADLETLGIYVPGAYMKASDNGDGTYTCKLNTQTKIGSYSAKTAPIVFPVNTPGYRSQAAPTGYVSDASSYTKQGMVYVLAGCRGRDEGAPSGVTDLKAALRYLRYNAGHMAGDTDWIFACGHSGGGAQTAILGASGDSSLYDAYLKEIGAVTGVSDAIAGAMAWCPITNLDVADAAYEWNMGSTRSGLSDEEQELSDGLAAQFAKYINKLGLKDENGNTLTLKKSTSGIYQSGSYYTYMKKTIEDALNVFLKHTEWPYNASDANQEHAGMTSGAAPSSMNPSSESDSDRDSAVDRSGTYASAQDYIDALNANGTWVRYDADSNTATITSIADFAKAMKNASKDVGAFDSLDKREAENTLFGTDGQSSHFDAIEAKLLKGTTYESAYTEDLETKDSQGNTVSTRVNMYNPMYYLSRYYNGYQTSSVAKYWRIRTGINQGDTSLSTEMDLALALENYGDTDVDFATVWGQGHTQAESSGSATKNFISWIKKCTKNKK